MNNLLISIKKFFTNKNVVTVIGVIIILLLLYFGYSSVINQEVQPIEVPVAKTTIQPRTLITEDMITYISVPSVAVSENVIRNNAQIVGKYSNINSVIPAGSMFYKDVVVSKEDIPDTVWTDIKEGERPYSFSVTFENTYGNSIMPGNKIDIYMKAVDDSGQVMVGRLLEKVEVLAVKDSEGKNVFENTDEARRPAIFLFGVPEDIYILLKKTEYLESYGVELFPVPYGGNVKIEGSISVDREELVAYIESKTVNFSTIIDSTVDDTTIEDGE